MSVRLQTFESGLRLVTEEMPGLQSASIGIWVSAGCRNERPEQNGIAHFLEHMAFKGTKKRTAFQIAETIEDVGGIINAYTSRETTAYYARILKDDLILAFDVLSDIVLNSVFDQREIEVERGVILQEIGQSLDTPDDVIFDWLQEVCYPDQPMGKPILGPAERVRQFSREDLETFISEQYVPGQIIVAAAGAVDHDVLAKAVEEAFGNKKKAKLLDKVPSRWQGGEYRVEKELEQAHLAMAFEAPSFDHQDLYTAQIYSMALGGGMTSRLFQEAREKRGLCYSISAQAGAYSDSGQLTIYSGTSEADIGDLANLCIDEIRRSAETMTEVEVTRARTQMKAGMMLGLESPSARCERLARTVGIWGRVPELEEIVARIDGVSLELVSGYAKGLVDAGEPALALYGPVGNCPDHAELLGRLRGG